MSREAKTESPKPARFSWQEVRRCIDKDPYLKKVDKLKLFDQMSIIHHQLWKDYPGRPDSDGYEYEEIMKAIANVISNLDEWAKSGGSNQRYKEAVMPYLLHIRMSLMGGLES